MKERPIVFSGDMIKAILDGRKTQTRRVITSIDGCKELMLIAAVNDGPDQILMPAMPVQTFISKELWTPISIAKHCPYGQPRDRLWVRETWRTEELDTDGLDGVRYKADNAFKAIENTVAASDAWIEANYRGRGKWRSPRFMPRWASRITLEIMDVRVERLQDISPDDAYKEGIQPIFTMSEPDCLSPYRDLWNSLNAKRGYPWEINPWVWALTFKVVT